MKRRFAALLAAAIVVSFAALTPAGAQANVATGTLSAEQAGWYSIGGGSTAAGCECALIAGVIDLGGPITPGSSPVTSVSVQVFDATQSRYWSGSAWQEQPAWVRAQHTAEAWTLAGADLSDDGAYQVRLVVRDSAGQTSRPPQNWIGVINTLNDSTDPTVSLDEPTPYRVIEPGGAVQHPNATHAARTLTLRGATEDDGFGVDRVLIRVLRIDDRAFWNGNTWQTSATWTEANLANSFDSWSLEVDFQTEGLYRVWLRARDGGGNESGVHDSPITELMFVGDTTIPTIALTSPVADVVRFPDGTVEVPGGAVGNRVLNFNGPVGDDASGVVRSRIQIEARAGSVIDFLGGRRYWNGTSWQVEPVWLDSELYTPFGQLRWRLTNVDLSHEGTYRVRLWVSDAAGNVSRAGQNPMSDINVV